MPRQTAIFKALTMLKVVLPPGIPAEAPAVCVGAQFHSPSPLLLHETVLPDGRTVILCGVCRDNVGVLQSLVVVRPTLPWEIRREFGNRLRGLVLTEETGG